MHDFHARVPLSHVRALNDLSSPVSFFVVINSLKYKCVFKILPRHGRAGTDKGTEKIFPKLDKKQSYRHTDTVSIKKSYIMRNHSENKKKQSTSWEPVQKWYKDIVGDEGHYYHQKIIIPNILRLLNLELESAPSVLDLACGQGVLARHLPKKVSYAGLDISPSLIKEAKKQDSSSNHHYQVADITKSLPLSDRKFSCGTIILALQNIEFPHLVFLNAAKHLQENAQLLIVLNHPCFRIPRQSSWQIDQDKKLQYRRIDRYFTPMQIPIQAHPSQGNTSTSTLSFHYPLSSFTHWLKEAGFFLEDIEEWRSDKISTGKAAKMENRSREEFPLFLTIVARLKSRII